MAKWKVTLKIEVPERLWSREVSQDFEDGAEFRHDLLDDFEILLQQTMDNVNCVKE